MIKQVLILVLMEDTLRAHRGQPYGLFEQS